MTTPGPRFADDDEAAQHWLALLRDGDRSQKIQARDQLAGIFERRGMLGEAVELLEGNGRAGVRTRDLFLRLAGLYRRVGRAEDAEAASFEAALLAPPASPPVATMPLAARTPPPPEPAPLAPPWQAPIGPTAQPRRGRTLRMVGFGCLGCGGLAVLGFIVLSVIAARGGTVSRTAAAPPATRETVSAAATVQPNLVPPSIPQPASAEPTPAMPASESKPSVAPPAPQPQAAPVAYEWVAFGETSMPNRQRFKAEIVVPPDANDEQMVTIFRDAVARAFRERPALKAVVVFAYSSQAEVRRGADKGKAQASSDRLGWAGDGLFDAFRDEGQVYLEIGNLIGLGGPTRKLAVARDGASTAPAAAKPAGPSRAAPQGSACPATHPIKGNRSSMLYHVPGGTLYARTQPEECFAAAADAEAAGYTRAQR